MIVEQGTPMVCTIDISPLDKEGESYIGANALLKDKNGTTILQWTTDDIPDGATDLYPIIEKTISIREAESFDALEFALNGTDTAKLKAGKYSLEISLLFENSTELPDSTIITDEVIRTIRTLSDCILITSANLRNGI